MSLCSNRILVYFTVCVYGILDATLTVSLRDQTPKCKVLYIQCRVVLYIQFDYSTQYSTQCVLGNTEYSTMQYLTSYIYQVSSMVQVMELLPDVRCNLQAGGSRMSAAA